MRNIQRAFSFLTAASMLLALATAWPAMSQTRVGDWSAGLTSDQEYMYAATVNDSGSVLMEACSFETGKCNWLITTDSACDGGETYPTLGNTDNGAAPLDLVCDGEISGGKHRLLFKNWESLERLINKSTRLGLAVPMQSDQFRVYRFSLNGMRASVEQMEAVFTETIKKQGAGEGKSTRTTVL